MSFNWRWEDKMGTCKMEAFKDGKPTDDAELNIYDCNGLFIAIHEFTTSDGEERYSVCDFGADEKHFKSCLDDKNFVHEYRLNMAFKNASKMAKCLIQAQSKGKWNGKLITYFEN